MTDLRGWVVRREAYTRELTCDLEDFGVDLLDPLTEPAEGEDHLGDVAVDVHYSSINYKDAMSLHGTPGIARRFPLIAGLDIVGEVVESRHPRFSPGDVVAIGGSTHGETQHGGLATRAHARGDELTALPEVFTERQAAGIGTAGVTAAIAALHLADHGVRPGDGPIVVTGAGGGVGSFAIALLAGAGYEVVAATGRPDELGDRMRELGAADVIGRDELTSIDRPLQAETWAGAVDSVGGPILAGILARTRQDGAVAACGMAGGTDLPTTVLPFILRGVALLGVNSVRQRPELRRRTWELLARDLDPAVIDSLTREVPLGEAKSAAAELLAGRGTGRIVVDARA